MATYQHLIDVIFSAKNAGATQAEIEKVFKSMDKGSKEVSTATKKMGDFEKALRRVIIVAPVWMIARTAMMSFFRGFSEGFKYMEDFNAAMLKAEAVTHGVTGSMSEAMNDLAGRIRNLAQETGESMTKIANAFYQFGTIGLDFETSWKGAEAATRFALATQEDSAKIAKTLAMTYRILGDTIDKTIPSDQAMEVELAKMYKLWQLNAGESGDLTASLAAFLPTANTMNLTMDETIALLSTLKSAALLGSRGGTLLRTSFSKLIDNMDELASSMGIYVNPQLDSNLDILLKIVSALKQLTAAQKIPVAAQEIITKIFGGVRGGEPIKALVALYDVLIENLDISTKKYSEQTDTMKDYQKGIDLMVNSVSGQLKIFRELRTQLFEQFITGVTGANDFAGALKNINKIMEEIVNNAQELGRRISSGTLIPFLPHEILPIGKKPIEKPTEYTEDTKKFIDGLDRIKNSDREIVEIKKQEVNINENLLRKLDLQKKDIQEQVDIQNLINAGYNESDILIAKIANEVSKIVNQYNSLDAVQNKIIPQLDEQEVLSNVLSENWEKVLQLTNQQPFIQEKILDLAKQVNNIELEKTKVLEDNLELSSSILEVANEENSTIIKHEMYLRYLIYGEDYLKNSMEDRVKLAQALTKEADEQERKSSRLIELFKITKQYGRDIGQEVSRFLGGMIEFRQLSPKAVEALRRLVPTEFEVGKAEEFFRATYPGFKFPETIEKERILERNVQILNRVMIEPISIDVNLESEVIIEKVKNAILEELDNKQSELSKKINESIEEF